MIIKDTFYTLAPINWLLISLALSNIQRKRFEVKTFRSIIKRATYIVVLTFVNFLCLYLKLYKDKTNIRDRVVKFSNVIQMAYWIPYFVYIIDLYFVQKYSGNALIKYIKTFDAIDETLVKADYDKIRRTLIITMVLSIGAFLFVSLFDYFIGIAIEGWEDSTIYAVDYMYWFFNILTILDGISHVIQVEYRLKIIQRLLQTNNSVPLIRTITSINHIGTFHEDLELLNPLKKPRFTRNLDTATLIKCYLQLLEQVNFLNTSYGFRVVVHFVNMLFNLINFLNLAIRPVEAFGASPITSPLFLFLVVVSGLIRALNYEFMAIMLMYRCEQAYRQSDKILETIDVLLSNTKVHSETKIKLLAFRNLLLTRPIKFHAAKFFTMDYRTLLSLNSVVITYTILMRQNI